MFGVYVGSFLMAAASPTSPRITSTLSPASLRLPCVYAHDRVVSGLKRKADEALSRYQRSVAVYSEASTLPNSLRAHFTAQQKVLPMSPEVVRAFNVVLQSVLSTTRPLYSEQENSKQLSSALSTLYAMVESFLTRYGLCLVFFFFVCCV